MCYEGTLIVVFYEKGKWYICTRKCLDATTSQWIKGVSYYTLFMEAIKDKFTIENLDKRYCYHFVLIHHKNRNIVDYSYLGKQYKTVALVMTTEKYTHNRINCVVSDKILYPRTMTFKNMDEIIAELTNISAGDEQTYNISTEGFMARSAGIIKSGRRKRRFLRKIHILRSGVGKARKLAEEIQFHLAHGSVALFGYDDRSLPLQFRVITFVIAFAVNKRDDIGVLFQRARFAQV